MGDFGQGRLTQLSSVFKRFVDIITTNLTQEFFVVDTSRAGNGNPGFLVNLKVTKESQNF